MVKNKTKILLIILILMMGSASVIGQSFKKEFKVNDFEALNETEIKNEIKPIELDKQREGDLIIVRYEIDDFNENKKNIKKQKINATTQLHINIWDHCLEKNNENYCEQRLFYNKSDYNYSKGNKWEWVHTAAKNKIDLVSSQIKKAKKIQNKIKKVKNNAKEKNI